MAISPCTCKMTPKEITSKMSADLKPAEDHELPYEACYKVLNCAELLEMILLNVYDPLDAFAATKWSSLGDSGKCNYFEQCCSELKESRRDMKTLLLSQRVNRMFHGMIKGSIKLRQALWFMERFNTSTSGTGKTNDAPIVARANPLLIDWEQGPLEIRGFWTITDKWCHIFIHLSKIRPWDSDYEATLSGSDVKSLALEQPESKEPEKSKSETGDASWRGMLVAQSTQPVCYDIAVFDLRFGCEELSCGKPIFAQQLRDDEQRRDMAEDMEGLLKYEDVSNDNDNDDDDGEGDDDA